MVLAFFRGSSVEGSLDHVIAKSVSMLGDARHSFDLATLAVLTDTDPAAVADDIRETDRRINQVEHDLRSELVVHVSVQGNADIGSVLGFNLLLKKIERIGDQAKNILDLAENGVSLTEHPEIESLLEGRQAVSELFQQAGDLLADPQVNEADIEAYAVRVNERAATYQERIDGFMTSERPGYEVVPLAIYYRYLRRIVANLLGVVRTSAEPLPALDGGDDNED